jgi:hypothetical protein
VEEAYQLEDYLPLSYKNSSEQNYIGFLWDAFASNHASGKYQFAFLAYHMLTMAAVYFNIWQIRHHLPNEFKAAMVGFNLDHEKELLCCDSPFAFHCVNESGVMRFMKLLGVPNDKIGNYTKLVKDRNSIAHCNAVVYPSDEKTLDTKVAEVLRVIDEIQTHSKPVIEKAYGVFLVQSGAKDDWQYDAAADQVREIFVHGNYLSRKDIDICLGHDISNLSNEPTFAAIQELHDSLQAAYPASDDETPTSPASGVQT